MRVTLVHNPAAGKQRKDSGERLVGLLEAEGYKVRYVSSKDDGWKAALTKRADLIVVAGGDGTIGKVARRIVGRGVPLAPLPAGTANNISRSLGLAERPFEELVRGLRDARRVKLDIGIAKGPWGKRYFVEGLGLGLFASMLAQPRRKGRRRKFASPHDKIVHGLEKLERRVQRCKPIALKASLDGKDISGNYLLLEAVNLLYVGPSLFLAPDSRPGDGQLDVVLVTEAERDRLCKYLSTWQTNKKRLAVLPSHKGTHLKLEWSGFDIHIDDKLWPEHGENAPTQPRRIEARLDGHAVEFLVPVEKKG